MGPDVAGINHLAGEFVAADVARYGSGTRIGKSVHRRRTRAILVGAGVTLAAVSGVTVALVFGHVAPVSHVAQASPKSTAGVQATPAPNPFGLGLTGTSAELQFSNLRLGNCPAADAQYIGSSFSGGWRIAVQASSSPSDQSVNMLALPSSPFGVAMNGTIGPTGSLDVSGDSSIQSMRLRLELPRIPAGNLAAAIAVTGSADVSLHFVGSPNIGTVTGDCSGTYAVAGTISPP